MEKISTKAYQVTCDLKIVFVIGDVGLLKITILIVKSKILNIEILTLLEFQSREDIVVQKFINLSVFI